MSETPMMIIEGLKTLKIILKRMSKNSSDIERYSSQPSNERPYFDSEDRQKQEVRKLIQSNLDLYNRYLHLKNRIDYTNLMTRITIQGTDHSLNELLVIQRKLAPMLTQTYRSLNDNAGQQRLRNMTHGTEKQPHVVRFYREDDKRTRQKEWQDLLDEITTRLEVVNATTPLLDLPSST